MIIRVKHQRNYTVARNQTVRDPRISFRATGLLVYLLSLTDDARINFRILATVKKEGEKAVLAAMKELQTAGYLTRNRIVGERGRWMTEITVREIPERHRVAFSATHSTATRKTATLKYEVPIERTAYEDGPCALCYEVATQRDARGQWLCPDHLNEGQTA